MKTIFPALLMCCAILTGCAQHYIITLHGGNQIAAAGKPRLEGGYYRYTDLKGQTAQVPVTRVREVSPASMASPRESSGY